MGIIAFIDGRGRGVVLDFQISQRHLEIGANNYSARIPLSLEMSEPSVKKTTHKGSERI